MSHLEEVGVKFLERLIHADEQIARELRGSGCLHCGGPLHRADFPRKPRGLPDEVEGAFSSRHSFCCGHCRKRATPPSLRFMGRKVYVAHLVVRACLSWQELAGRVRRLVLGVPRRTVGRWNTWWRSGIPATEFWRMSRARLMPPVDVTELPRALVERFGAVLDNLTETLVFLAPITTGSAGELMVEIRHAEDGAS